MQELEQTINLYHTACLVCLVLAIVFLAITVFLFFKLEILKIFNWKTGRDKKRSIQKMEEMNDRTGKLRTDADETPVRLKAEQRVVHPATQPNLEVHAQTAKQHVVTQAPSEAGIEDTTILNDASETSLLFDPGTTVLSQNPLAASRKMAGRFVVVKEIMWVHTEEVL